MSPVLLEASSLLEVGGQLLRLLRLDVKLAKCLLRLVVGLRDPRRLVGSSWLWFWTLNYHYSHQLMLLHKFTGAVEALCVCVCLFVFGSSMADLLS